MNRVNEDDLELVLRKLRLLMTFARILNGIGNTFPNNLRNMGYLYPSFQCLNNEMNE